MQQVINEIALLAKDYKYILLNGDLGAGKTTFSKELVAKLGIDEIVTSPTFSIHNTYRGNG
ncbi:MAG: tRNA (adenosine(37)-N6)-threonylcarbamoyltransferase complex ATPase subunit type 1 TsaE, partial [Deferribacteraceae bacterium]|nr:tRNA (adenosine(37)-N6)-threonylcarbamoyltransferase complex ATPase subunit type 1 TsaE [Deferribacteraceae bacterium]